MSNFLSKFKLLIFAAITEASLIRTTTLFICVERIEISTARQE
jgi:hypothetical protein